MTRVLLKCLSALLIACLLIPAPLALMEEPTAIEEPELAEAAPAEEALEGPVEEVSLDLGGDDDAPANEVEDGLSAKSDDQVLELSAEEPVTVESEALEAELTGEADGEALPKEASRFPDPNFRNYLVQYDKDGDGLLSDDEIGKIYRLEVEYSDIYSLEGLKYLSAVKNVICTGNQLTELDVTHNPKLNVLECSQNQLSTLDVSQNPELLDLKCSQNQLSKLDVSQNPELFDLECEENVLTTMDISHNPELVNFFCSDNALSKLTVGDHPKLEWLACDGNDLNSLDVSKCPKLRVLRCYANSFEKLDISMLTLSEVAAEEGQVKENGRIIYGYNNDMYSISIDEDVELITGAIGDGVVSLDEDNFPDENLRDYIYRRFDVNRDYQLSRKELDSIKQLGDEMLGALDFYDPVSSLKGIELLPDLELIGIPIADNVEEADFSGNPKLMTILIDGAKGLKRLNVSRNTALKKLKCVKTALTSLDVSQNTALEELNCSYNALTNLNVSNNKALYRLDCGNNKISKLDVSGNPALKSLSCRDNELTNLDVSKNSALGALDCDDNKLTELDVSRNTALTELFCIGNKLQNLILGKQDKLIILQCEGNLFTSLDISGCQNFLKVLNSPDKIVEENTAEEGYKYTEYDLWADEDYMFSVNSDVALMTGNTLPVFKLSRNAKHTVNIGDKFRVVPQGLTATGFSSNKTGIAEVSNDGVVTAKAEGKATITVKAGKKSLKLTLTVKDPTLPTGIKLSLSGTVEHDCNKPMQLSYTLLPEGTAVSGVTWKTSSKKIADVDQNGLVKPVKEGKVTITATTTRGKKKYSAKVTLKLYDPLKPTGIHLDRKGTLNLDVQDDRTLKLTATLEPATAQSEITWKSSSTKIAEVKDGVVTIHKAGTVTITATATKIKKSAKVKLVIKDQHAPKKITINQGKSITLRKGATLTLTTTITGTPGYEPRKAVKWVSSKPGVVSVDDSGKITAVAPGTAKITVTAEKAKASISVKVPKTE